jgi:hypothetical protein
MWRSGVLLALAALACRLCEEGASAFIVVGRGHVQAHTGARARAARPLTAMQAKKGGNKKKSVREPAKPTQLEEAASAAAEKGITQEGR